VLRFVRLATLSALVALAACDLINTPTKTANGELYQSGDPRYDQYFSAVHQEQVAAAAWPDESKAAKKPIVTALNLRPGASNTTILSATRAKKGDAALGSAVDETVHGEREFAKKQAAAVEKLDELEKKGEELKKQAALDRHNMGAERADEKKRDKKDEVKREITAAVDAVDSMATDARHGAKEADELARKLRGAWTGTDDEEAAPKDEPKKDEPAPAPAKEEPKKEEPAKKPSPAGKHPAGPKKPPPEPAEKPPVAEKPAPKPPPAEKGPDEVFNP
jgi:hypothetical protein